MSAAEPIELRPDAAQNEAEGVENVDLDWEGITITIPVSVDEWDIDTLEAFETGKAATGIRALIGSARYDAVKAEFAKAHGRKFKVKDAASLMDAVAVACGFKSAGD